MKTINKFLTVLILLSLFLAGTPIQSAYAAGVRYAKLTASGTGDCSSWENACTLQTALTGASSGDQIWVAAGTYTPHASDRAVSFTLKNGVAIYGGFAGTESLLTQRDPATNATILSGDLNGDDDGFANNSENSFHVLVGGGTDSTAVLDGFTVTGGKANGSFNPNAQNVGGGMYNDGGSPTVTNVTFSGNYAVYGGGMLNNNNSSPTVTNVTFSGNLATTGGGGMYNWNSSSPTITNVTISGNSAASGGGMYNWVNSSPTLTNVIIANSLSGGDCVNDASTLNAASSNNLIEDSANACGLTNGSDGNIIGQDPALGPLTGAPAYFLLLSSSPAIDAGTNTGCPATDQRGVARPQGSQCDIGAYEYEGDIYTITFDSAGGSPVASITQDYGSAITPPADPTRTGYTFAGWSPALPATMPAEDLILTAQWEINQYTISFDSAGGSLVASITQDYGSAITAPANPTRTDYIFTGWSPALPATMPAEDLILTAQWTTNAYTVTFNANGGSGTMSPQSREYNTTAALNANTFTRAGYNFNGWNTQADGSGTAYADGANYTFVADLTLFAQWITINTYTVTFNANGGSGTMVPQVASASTALKANTFTRAGYTFNGWNTQANGFGSAYANGAIYAFNADIILYAQWLTASPTFPDVSTDFWAWEFIERLANAGITSGFPDGTFRPGDPVTRGQLAVFLLKGMNFPAAYTPPQATEFNFTDIESHWARHWIEALRASGITGGFSDGSYRPDNPVTRAQMAIFVLKAINGPGYEPPPVAPTFDDTADHWASDWIEALRASGLTGGYPDGTFRPNNPVTRAEMAVFIVNAFELP